MKINYIINMSNNKSEIRKMKESFKPVIELYQSLPIEQCVELYLKQYDNLDYCQKRTILSIIGAKTVYKDEYRPHYKTSMKNEQKNDETCKN